MITKNEELEYRIELARKKSQKLKANHKHGDWVNWRTFIGYDMRVKELTIELLQLEIEQLNDSLITYSDY